MVKVSFESGVEQRWSDAYIVKVTLNWESRCVCQK